MTKTTLSHDEVISTITDDFKELNIDEYQHANIILICFDPNNELDNRI